MINKFLLSTVAMAALAGTAFAADLPSRRAPPVFAPPPPIPVFTWTGVYVGGQVGYEFGRNQGLAIATATGIGLAARGAREDGVIGGGHIGYNFSTQSLPLLSSAFSTIGGAFGGAGVVGIEGDVDGSSARANYALGGINVNARNDIQGSIRGRVGIAVDRVLFYATGGAAFGDLRNGYTNTITGVQGSQSKTRVGYTVGGGIEYGITNNVSVRAEYRYTDFGNNQDTLAITNGGVAVRHRDTEQRVQGGFSYKFNTFSPIAPVVARY